MSAAGKRKRRDPYDSNVNNNAPIAFSGSGSTDPSGSKQFPSSVDLLDAMPAGKLAAERAISKNVFMVSVGAPQTADAAPEAQPAAKKARKKKDADPPEKRGAVFKKACPKNIHERVDRVISQRFFMIERRRDGDELREEFSVLGSTGNVYTVVIDKRPTCNCPDAMKGNHCKHILFIFLKVLQVPKTSTHWYQKALLTEEVAEVFRNAPPTPTAVANARVRDAYAAATGKASGSSSQGEGSPNKKRRIPGKDDDCPICYDSMHGTAPETLAFCETCGNALHRECFQKWARSAPKLTCVWCRAEWVVAGSAGGSTSNKYSEGYVNLGNAAGVSPVRDTSSYYHGPRKGQRHYGYRDYDDDF